MEGLLDEITIDLLHKNPRPSNKIYSLLDTVKPQHLCYIINYLSGKCVAHFDRGNYFNYNLYLDYIYNLYSYLNAKFTEFNFAMLSLVYGALSYIPIDSEPTDITQLVLHNGTKYNIIEALTRRVRYRFIRPIYKKRSNLTLIIKGRNTISVFVMSDIVVSVSPRIPICNSDFVMFYNSAYNILWCFDSVKSVSHLDFEHYSTNLPTDRLEELQTTERLVSLKFHQPGLKLTTHKYHSRAQEIIENYIIESAYFQGEFVEFSRAFEDDAFAKYLFDTYKSLFIMTVINYVLHTRILFPDELYKFFHDFVGLSDAECEYFTAYIIILARSINYSKTHDLSHFARSITYIDGKINISPIFDKSAVKPVTETYYNIGIFVPCNNITVNNKPAAFYSFAANDVTFMIKDEITVADVRSFFTAELSAEPNTKSVKRKVSDAPIIGKKIKNEKSFDKDG